MSKKVKEMKCVCEILYSVVIQITYISSLEQDELETLVTALVLGNSNVCNHFRHSRRRTGPFQLFRLSQMMITLLTLLTLSVLQFPRNDLS